jgi:hypothetical protein
MRETESKDLLLLLLLPLPLPLLLLFLSFPQGNLLLSPTVSRT